VGFVWITIYDLQWGRAAVKDQSCLGGGKQQRRVEGAWNNIMVEYSTLFTQILNQHFATQLVQPAFETINSVSRSSL